MSPIYPFRITNKLLWQRVGVSPHRKHTLSNTLKLKDTFDKTNNADVKIVYTDKWDDLYIYIYKNNNKYYVRVRAPFFRRQFEDERFVCEDVERTITMKMWRKKW